MARAVDNEGAAPTGADRASPGVRADTGGSMPPGARTTDTDRASPPPPPKATKTARPGKGKVDGEHTGPPKWERVGHRPGSTKARTDKHRDSEGPRRPPHIGGVWPSPRFKTAKDQIKLAKITSSAVPDLCSPNESLATQTTVKAAPAPRRGARRPSGGRGARGGRGCLRPPPPWAVLGGFRALLAGMAGLGVSGCVTPGGAQGAHPRWAKTETIPPLQKWRSGSDARFRSQRRAWRPHR
ncbi:PREDICTED: translation initiation factor IF-2-like [Ficedula albicollis]|uniref:translation initiation factor IF-2-like n=1 Tax=Ficedula albicollis TaxID=59894 RepID=UPI0007AD94BD|nr:PREDICTED: translation initiation factor IF-2-like [Ficedula albicollis]